MTEEQAIKVIEIARRKADEFFDELISELGEPNGSNESPEGFADSTGDSPEPVLSSAGPLDTPLNGDWMELERSAGVNYSWPDGNIDEYEAFVNYQGTGDYSGMPLALGYNQNGDVVGFVVGEGGWKRGITYFFEADDFAQTDEKVSLIRGGGPKGKSGFAPGEELPAGYRGFKTGVLRDRKEGKWNVQGVVAKSDDFRTMLGHTALQARLRGIA